MSTQPDARCVSRPAPLRAGDSDRSAVVDLLRAHHLDGRLTVEEFEDRVERAHRAVALSTRAARGTAVLAHGVGPLNAAPLSTCATHLT
jgi:hypothetical protein